LSGGFAAGRQKRPAIVLEDAVVSIGAIPFEQGEFGVMPPAPFAAAKSRGDLKELLVAGGQQALHVKLGTGYEETLGVGGDGVDMSFGSHLAGKKRRLHFEKALLSK